MKKRKQYYRLFILTSILFFCWAVSFMLREYHLEQSLQYLQYGFAGILLVVGAASYLTDKELFRNETLVKEERPSLCRLHHLLIYGSLVFMLLFSLVSCVRENL